MKTTISSTVPTHYQSQSISAFGLYVEKHGNGSFSCSRTFDTKKEAIEYMINRAEMLAENSDELKQMKHDIKKSGRLYYDAACLSIE